MKKLLLFGALAFGLNAFGQLTYVPDDNFEAHLEANGMGNGIPNDDYVTTSNINGVTLLGLLAIDIYDVTGIEDFTALEIFHCPGNFLTSLDLTSNTNLTMLFCYGNQLTSLDVSSCTALNKLHCYDNLLTSLDVSQNTSLDYLDCSMNNLTSLNLSGNTILTGVKCDVNQLEYFNVANGNNINFSVMIADNNPSLSCIQVDDVTYSTTNWTNIDPNATFSLSCPVLGTIELHPNQPKELIKIVNLLGQEVECTPNTVLIYHYSNGTSEKVFTIEK